MKKEDVIIIGAGPAGIACAIQLHRFGIKPLVFEKNKIGGMINNANLIENYPGFDKGITGLKFAGLLKEHADHYSVNFRFQEVIKAGYEDGLFMVFLLDEIYHSKFLVFATGTLPKIPNEIEITPDINNRIFFDIITLIDCRDKKIVISGAGDLAFDYSLSLGTRNEIMLLNRNNGVKCLPVLKDRVNNLPHFSYHENCAIKKVINNRYNNLTLIVENQNKTFEIEADFLIFAAGRKPCEIPLDSNLKSDFDKLRLEGMIMNIGDLNNINCRQLAVAIGDGVKAAVNIYNKMMDCL
ncbi:MAG TPA: NAD(P)/FAD-dependent oxidoreductase [Ignavibacteria bacterium]|nr:NAD(P)/FAD-dependent oxidoreductase [Ignavibacteria bacterium]